MKNRLKNANFQAAFKFLVISAEFPYKVKRCFANVNTAFANQCQTGRVTRLPVVINHAGRDILPFLCIPMQLNKVKGSQMRSKLDSRHIWQFDRLD